MYHIMKIIVFSDSHGDTRSMEEVLRRETPDQILHLGDCVRDAQRLDTGGVPLLQVAGNCDYGVSVPSILTPVFQGVRVFMTHGHLHGVKTSYLRAIYAAQEAEAAILLFGHTHRAECFVREGLWVMNPGACNSYGSYGVIRITADGPSCCVKSVH